MRRESSTRLLIQSRDQIPEQECSGRDYTESVRFDPEDGGGSDWDAETYSGVPVACERNALGRPSRHQSRSCAWTSASGLTAGSREAEEQRLMRTAGKGGGGRKRGGRGLEGRWQPASKYRGESAIHPVELLSHVMTRAPGATGWQMRSTCPCMVTFVRLHTIIISSVAAYQP